MDFIDAINQQTYRKGPRRRWGKKCL